MNPDSGKARPAPPPPTIDDARIASERDDRLRSRRGRAATYVSSPQGRSEGGVATKMLLGQGG